MLDNLHLPYLLSYSPPVVEDIAIFFVAMLTAIMISAEGQAFAATLLGDNRKDAKDRLHFNVFLHMSIPGTISFFVAGFGWSRQVAIDTTMFKSSPKIKLVASRLAGPLANIILANIAASLNWLLGQWNVQDEVFSTIVVVNVTMAIYNLLPIPPLPGAAILYAILPEGEAFRRFIKGLEFIGPYLILCAFLVIRVSGWEGLANFFNPIVLSVCGFILNG